MKFTITESKVCPGHWYVDEDGKNTRALFMGPDAKALAEEYAEFKNGNSPKR